MSTSARTGTSSKSSSASPTLPVETVLYPVPFLFRGSGFYSTDYGRGGRKRDSSDSSGTEKKDKPPEKKAAEA
jgi:hypothetical protein